MKKLIPLLLLFAVISWDSAVFAQPITCPSGSTVLLKADTVIWLLPVDITDTIHEPILVSTRQRAAALTEMALGVRRNGICIKHLDCHGHELKYPVYVWDCDNEKKRREGR